ncbi:MAG TPA: hypothetical protein VK190_03530 [Pseudoneobacillus sp.]|nr:hypothetical protein [Pseudoneobacillus sp.]
MGTTIDVKRTLSDKIVNFVKTLNYGDSIAHEVMENLIGIPKSGEYYFIVARANRQLLKGKKMLRNIPGLGYEILEPDDYHEHSGNVFRKGYKKMKSSQKILENAPMELMSEEAKIKHIKTYDRICHYTSIVEAGVKEVRKIRKTPVNVVSNERIR